MFLYRSSHYAQQTVHLIRCSLHIDGFVSVHAGYDCDEMISKTFIFQDAELNINFAPSAAGGILVKIQENQRLPVSGYAVNDCTEFIDDKIN